MFLSATGKGDTEYHIQKRFSLSLNAMPLISLRALAIMLRTTRSQEAPIRDTITADEYFLKVHCLIMTNHLHNIPCDHSQNEPYTCTFCHVSQPTILICGCSFESQVMG